MIPNVMLYLSVAVFLFYLLFYVIRDVPRNCTISKFFLLLPHLKAFQFRGVRLPGPILKEDYFFLKLQANNNNLKSIDVFLI